MGQVGDSLQNAVNMDADAFAAAFQMNMSGEDLAELMMSMDSGQNATYENNLRTLGYINFAEPGGIDIYPKDFESKEEVVRILDDYNSRMESEGKEEQVITYTECCRFSDVFRDGNCGYNQLCSDCVCGDVSDCVFDYDRSHYLYQCTGTEKGDRYSAGYRGIKA